MDEFTRSRRKAFLCGSRALIVSPDLPPWDPKSVDRGLFTVSALCVRRS